MTSKRRSIGEFRCPKCGAGAALSLSALNARTGDVAVKCLTCAHVTRLPSERVAGLGGRDTSTP